MTESPYAALKLPDYRLLLLGRLLGTIAVQIQAIAVGWQIYAITKNPLSLGLIGLAEALPSIGVALYAGHVADILDRQTDCSLRSRYTLVLSMVALSVGSYSLHDNSVLVPVIFIIIAFSGIARGFYGPAVFGIMSDIVPRPLMGNASAWSSTVWQASAVIGPMIGGFIYVALAAPLTYAVSTVLMLGSLCCFFLVKARTELKAPKHDSVLANIREGLDFVFSNQVVLGCYGPRSFCRTIWRCRGAVADFFRRNISYGPRRPGHFARRTIDWIGRHSRGFDPSSDFEKLGQSVARRRRRLWTLYDRFRSIDQFLPFSGHTRTERCARRHQRLGAFDYLSAGHAQRHERPGLSGQQHLYRLLQRDRRV